MRMPTRLTALAAACMLATPALAQPTMPMQPNPADSAMMAGMRNMQHGMAAAPMTGDPDKDFVAQMLPHHQGAIAMAKVELQYGKDPAMRKLAAAIIAAQQDEIAEMQRWQAAHPGG